MNPFAEHSTVIADVSFDDEIVVPRAPSRFLTADERAALKKYVEEFPLDDDQRAVCNAPREGVHKILAGAGSGKTLTLISRALNILANEPDVEPYNLVLITFTNKAGKEIKKRFLEALQKVLKTEHPPMPFIGTIHSFAYSLISANEGHSQTILSEGADLSLLRKSIRRDVFPDQKEKWAEANIRVIHEVMQKLIVDNELHLFVTPTWIDGELKMLNFRDPLWTPELKERYKYLDATARTMVASAGKLFWDDQLRHETRAYYAIEGGISIPDMVKLLTYLLTIRYTQRSFNFSDILYYPFVYLLNHPAALARAQKKYKHISIDEAQDCDTLQFALLRLIYGQ